MTDLDDTSRCPLGHRCESCGIEGNDLAVSTATSRLGVMCLTLCRRCAAYDDVLPVTVGTAVKLVLQHCIHLGIDADEMDEILRGDR